MSYDLIDSAADSVAVVINNLALLCIDSIESLVATVTYDQSVCSLKLILI